MFIAMNRFCVAKGSEAAFEHVWMSRDTHLHKVPGFVEFHLLKGPDAEDHALYASPTIWDSRAAFEAWTNSEAFRAAHRSAGDNKPLKGRPVRDAPHMRPEIARETLANSAATVAYGETIAIRISARDASGLTSITPYWRYRSTAMAVTGRAERSRCDRRVPNRARVRWRPEWRRY